MAATRAQGTTLKFTPAGGTQVVVGKLTSVGEIAPEAEEVDITTLESTGGYREYMQGFRDSGELEITGFHDADDAGQTALRTAFASGVSGSFEVKFPDDTAVTFSGFIKSHTIGSAEVDGAIGFGAVIRISGAVTVTEG
ncbi:MAG: phage tail tube protein [Clostridia bacterium]|nr:phage tail tube protein [Clostridia bacterium]